MRRSACWLVLLCCLAAPSMVAAGKYNQVLDLGDKAPAWEELPGVDGKQHSLKDLQAQEFVVLFFHSCSCPVAEDYEARIIEFTKTYGGPEGRVAVVGINVSKLEEDRLPAMKTRAEAKGFNFPYLFDESQEIAREYGALWTPEFFVLNRERKIVYMGGFDDSSNPETVMEEFLVPAVTALLAGEALKTAETPAIGCRIRYERQRRRGRTRAVKE